MFRLFVNSTTGVDIYPEYDYKENAEKIETRNRSREGSEYPYKWGDVKQFSFSVSHVNSSFKAQVNSWWDANIELLWMEVGVTAVTAVHLINKTKPIDALVKPYADLFKGKIELGTY